MGMNVFDGIDILIISMSQSFKSCVIWLDKKVIGNKNQSRGANVRVMRPAADVSMRLAA